MSVIEDLRTAIENYETDNCKTEIVDFSYPGTVLNVGETFQFKIKVTNQSCMDMKNVKVRALGTAYADVAWGLPTAPFGSTAVSGQFNLDAWQSYTVTLFRGRAKVATSTPKDIVTARIDAWDASLDHLLADHSGAGVAEGKLTTTISPS